MNALHVSPQAIFRRENFVATVTFVRLLSGSMNHDFVSPVVRDAGEILVTFIASVQNPGVLVNGDLVTFQVIAALHILVADVAYEILVGRSGVEIEFDVDGHLGSVVAAALAAFTALAPLADAAFDAVDVAFVALQIVGVVEGFHTYVAGVSASVVLHGAVNSEPVAAKVEPVLEVLLT